MPDDKKKRDKPLTPAEILSDPDWSNFVDLLADRIVDRIVGGLTSSIETIQLFPRRGSGAGPDSDPSSDQEDYPPESAPKPKP